MTDFKLKVLSSVLADAESNKLKALTSLELLLDKPVGIGDHSTKDYHDNVKEAMQSLIDAEDTLEILEKHFKISSKG